MTYGDNNMAEAAFGGGDFSQMAQGVGFDPNAALAAPDYGYGMMDSGGFDPNAGIQQFMVEQQSGVPATGMYGYDASLPQQGGFFQGGQGMQFASQGQGAQPFPSMSQQPQFQQPQFQQPQFQAQNFQQGQPMQQEYMGMFGQPQFQQGQFQQGQFQQGQPQFQPQNFQMQQGQPQFQQPQQPAALTPDQFFQNPALQNGQVPPQMTPQQAYGQAYGQNVGQQFQVPQQYAQFQQGAQPMQNYGVQGQQQFGQPNAQPQQQADPLARYDQQIQTLEEKYAANEVAFAMAQQRGDVDSMTQLARERGSIQGQLSATYTQRGQEEITYANQRMLGVQQEYQQNMTQLMQSYFGYTPTPQDYQEFQNLMGVIMTPQSADAMRDPLVQQMVLKSYAFDKMSGQRRAGPSRAAPRDFIPNMSQPVGGGNNFGMGQQQMAQPSFLNMSENQRISLLTTGRIAPR